MAKTAEITAYLVKKVIEFYVPVRYKSKAKYVPLAMRGKILEFKNKKKA